MIVLNKKAIRIFVLSIFVCVLGLACISDQKESVPTVSLPVSGKTIVIDAGHGKPDEGGSLLKSEKVAYIRYLKK